MSRYQTAHRFDGEYGTEKHKRFILSRAVRKCKFEPEEHVVYKGAKYQIVNILDEDLFEYVAWDGLTPLFVELWQGSESDTLLIHPGHLKRRHKK